MTERSSVVKTVLESCVAVRLRIRVQEIGDMNQSLYPSYRKKEKTSEIFSNSATTALVSTMDGTGFKRCGLFARIFEGGYIDGGSGSNIGEKNAPVVRKILSNKGSKVVSEVTGGSMGRKIISDVSSDHVFSIQGSLDRSK